MAVSGNAMEYVGMSLKCSFGDELYEFVAGVESRAYGNAGAKLGCLIVGFNI